MSPIDDPITRRFIEEAGNTTQALGVGRVAGQVYAYLYFSAEPRSLDDMKEALGISKGGASMCVRQLEQWGAVQRVWVKGDRKDYYTANDYFGRLIRNLVQDVVGKRITAFTDLLDRADAELHSGQVPEQDNHRFLKDRIQRLRAFQHKAQGLWNNPIVKMMVK
jgi:DNA-binding transcriptional regulator GbsR (MarR family)